MFILVLLGILVVIGVFCLFVGVIGFLWLFFCFGEFNLFVFVFFDMFEDGVLIIDIEGWFVYVNKVYFVLIGVEIVVDIWVIEWVFFFDLDVVDVIFCLL